MASVTPFAQLIEALKPGATGKDIVALLDGKAERTRALHWRAGRRGSPQWAVDLLRSKLRQRHEQERAIADRQIVGPGSKAGARNLAVWQARPRS